MMISGIKLFMDFKKSLLILLTTLNKYLKVYIPNLIIKNIDGLNCDFDEVDEFLDDLKKNVYNYAADYLKKLFSDINTNLLRKFNNKFNKDENGKNRDWKLIEENEIKDLHLKVKEEVGKMIDDFKYMKIPRNNMLGDTLKPSPRDEGTSDLKINS